MSIKDITNYVRQTPGNTNPNVIKSMIESEIQERPACITGKGAPTTATVGAVGCLYMDTLTGDVYKCTGFENDLYIWGAMDSVPTPTSADEGKFLRVVNGSIALASVINAEEDKY